VHAAALADTAAFAGGANSAPDAVRRAREAVAEAGARDALDAVLLADAERALGLPARHSVHTTFGPLLRRRPPLALQAQLRAGAGRSEAGRGSELTARESEVLALLADGLTNREMAQRLAVGTRTIDTHVERILGKLAVASRTRAVAVALRGGLVPPPLSGLL
jgi:ATP/maltotriose-dependent transcriptional regulator MalT